MADVYGMAKHAQKAKRPKSGLTLKQKEERLTRVIAATEKESFKNARQWAIKHSTLSKMKAELYRIKSILAKYQK